MPPSHSLRRVTATLAVALAAGSALAAPASAAPVFGYGDQNADLFTDPRWAELPLKDVRRLVDWDTSTNASKTAALDTWMAAAQTAGARPLLAIDRSWSPGKGKAKPSIPQYSALIRWLKARYPTWSTLTPWNEANFRLQPTAKDPKLAAAYWNAAKASCPGCTVTSPVVLAWTGAPKTWVRDFIKASKNKVRLWSVHVYGDQNRLTDASLKALEKQLPGKLWVTEAAGWVKFLDSDEWAYDEARAARAIEYTFKAAKKHQGRVERWYFYQWRGERDENARWDSGVLNADGTERLGYVALKRGLTGVGPAAPKAPKGKKKLPKVKGK